MTSELVDCKVGLCTGVWICEEVGTTHGQLLLVASGHVACVVSWCRMAWHVQCHVRNGGACVVEGDVCQDVNGMAGNLVGG